MGCFKNGEKLDLFGFTDSDYADDLNDRKSTSDYIYIYDGFNSYFMVFKEATNFYFINN